ncbi:hypothetical protein [Stakelama tenebrarum]|uniref:Uncharacterized protein n=1 Tax=Stakelama tenebrarum TaxID=2711215 RepID=A0A6G6Y8W2_9SPHN|nr:hypothetical protein [Sphingosinithalassobacter tenebrarum]QIG81350.1 hypothetical protein G5C33_17210 [Sphingosinithalassobacter tenebrarum]
MLLWLVVVTFAVLTGAQVIPKESQKIDVRPDFSGPVRNGHITLNPSADIKRSLLAANFDYRRPVETNIDTLLRTGFISRAFMLAYLGNDHAAMVRVARHVGEQSREAEGPPPYAFLTMVDQTLLAEGDLWEQLGNRELALQRYYQYFAVLHALGAIAFDPSVKNLPRRLTIVRIKIFQLKKGMQGRTAFITRQLESFFDDFRWRWPYAAYRKTLETRPPARASDEVAQFDHCLESADPHGWDRFAPPAPQDCDSDRFATRWGYDLFGAILAFDHMHRALAHTQRIEQDSKPRIAATATIVSLSQVFQFIGDVGRRAPEATFLVDDLVADFLSPETGATPEEYQANPGGEALSVANLQSLLCGTGLIAPNNAASFDRQPELIARAAELGVSCGLK